LAVVAYSMNWAAGSRLVEDSPQVANFLLAADSPPVADC